MKKNKITKFILSGALCLLTATSCDVDPTFYTQVVPETFYTSQEAVWERFNRPFTHWRWYVGQDSPRWLLQELGTDEFCQPTRGSDWFDGAN
ncbi:MAG: RagB/SusD family nutrient uptake outer membrane protein, partial [Prevotella sp.]|nr:RagB/SusD family nutrient uptake outer membrane protein [Prevotella sp.]